MRGPKDEGKMTSPMFPRLHVNDTGKGGGPRAPPRNKMALYEQLSIPSQKASSPSASLLPLPSNNNGSKLVPSMTSTLGGNFEKGVFTPFCNTSVSSHSEKHRSRSFSRVKLNMASQEPKSMNSDQSLKTTQQSSSCAESKSLQSHKYSKFKNFSWNELENEKDFGVPSFAQSGDVLQRSSKHQDQNGSPCWNLSFSMHFQDVSEKQRKGIGSIDQKAKKSNASRELVDRLASVSSVQDKILTDASLSPSNIVKSAELLKQAHSLSNQKNQSISGDILKGLHGSISSINRKFVSMQEKIDHQDKFLVETALSVAKENASKVRHEKCSKFSLGVDKRSHNKIENCLKNNEEKHGPLDLGDIERQDDVSESSTMDSISALVITPDDVVRVIGERRFLKARRDIINQQRVFMVQVFELHRLVKVQKSIAGSPNLLFEDNIYLGKASLEISPVKKVVSEKARDQPSVICRKKDASQKPHPIAEFSVENAVAKLPLPCMSNETSKELLNQQRSYYGSHLEGVQPASTAANARQSSQWCFPPPGNQWLVPVESPSEGLVYKPYAGLCPPTGGILAPVYGNCSPMILPAGGGDFMNAAAYASHHQGIGILPATPPLGHRYFPPYAMPVMAPSASAVEQVNLFVPTPSKDNQMSVQDINFTFPHQSSCNMSSQVSRVISSNARKASKENEVQGSTASSPSETPRGGALPLFPTEPTTRVSDQNGQPNEVRTHVIRVVPRNPRLATESAARIFQSIQEERKLYD